MDKELIKRFLNKSIKTLLEKQATEADNWPLQNLKLLNDYACFCFVDNRVF